MTALLFQSITPVVVIVAFFWLRSDMKCIEEKVDGLAREHNAFASELNALAREVSEVKAYLRGTLPE